MKMDAFFCLGCFWMRSFLIELVCNECLNGYLACNHFFNCARLQRVLRLFIWFPTILTLIHYWTPIKKIEPLRTQRIQSWVCNLIYFWIRIWWREIIAVRVLNPDSVLILVKISESVASSPNKKSTLTRSAFEFYGKRNLV